MEPPIDVSHEAARSWNRFSRLELIVIVALAIVVISQTAFGWLLWDADRTIGQLARDTNTRVQNDAKEESTLKTQFSRQEAALRKLAEEQRQMRAVLEELAARPPTVIVLREGSGKDSVTIIQPTPSPQPTATVTCDPTPIIGNCRKGQRP